MATSFTLDASVWFFAGQMGDTEPVRHVPIDRSPFHVGRSEGLSMTLPSPCVSKEHAELFVQDEALWVRDLHSTNGTYVNGDRVVDATRLKEGDLVQFATAVFRVGREKQACRMDTNTVQREVCDRALLMLQFDRLMNENAVVPFFQPIVWLNDRSFHGYEVLGRSRLFGLSSPKEMFTAASQLNLESDLSRMFRRTGMQVAQAFGPQEMLFVNTHPAELREIGLIDSLQELRRLHPGQPVTLEIHEAAVTEPSAIRELRTLLSDLDIKLAYDDFGAGQARLIELSDARPDYLKFDIKLVKDIDKATPSRQQLVESLVKLVDDLGIIPLAEGIEDEREHAVCKQIGFRLAQGFLYGKPGPIDHYANPTATAG